MNASSMNEKTALERESKSDANQSIVTSEEELTEISINLSHQPMPPLGPFREDHPEALCGQKRRYPVGNREQIPGASMAVGKGLGARFVEVRSYSDLSG